MTFAVWKHTTTQIDSRSQARFIAARDSVVGLIHTRMQKYEDALWAGVSTIESHDGDMQLSQWRTFARTLKINEKYPGINGIGVIHYVTPDQLGPYLAARRAERPDFAIFPAHDAGVTMPISFIEPEAMNAAAVGLDVAHEFNRRTAALSSRDTEKARITGPITLVQDAGHTPGILF